MSTVLAASALIGVLLTAEADAPRMVALRYERAPSAELCPDETVLRAAVSERLGRDPFQEGAATSLVATVARGSTGFVATLELWKGPERLGRRDLTSSGDECAQLASALALAISIAIDPVILVRTAAPPPEPASPPVVSAPSVAAAPVTSERAQVLATLDAVGSIAIAPIPTFGLAIGAEVRWPRLSVGFEVAGNFPGGEVVDQGQVQTWSLLGTLVPCFRWGPLGACLLAAAGAQASSGTGYLRAESAVDPLFALGARLLGELPIWSRLTARLMVDVGFPLTRTHLLVDGTEVWGTPPVSGSVGAGLAWRFP